MNTKIRFSVILYSPASPTLLSLLTSDHILQKLLLSYKLKAGKFQTPNVHYLSIYIIKQSTFLNHCLNKLIILIYI